MDSSNYAMTNREATIRSGSEQPCNFVSNLDLPNRNLGIVDPRPEDVLMGRGRPLQSHPGNIRFRNLVELHFQEYESSNTFERMLIAGRIVQIIKATGARFLKPKIDSAWEEMDDLASRKKVTQCFRTRRKKFT